MTAQEIIDGEDIPTMDQLKELNSSDLRKVANKVFEIKNVSKFSKDELLYSCGEQLTEYQEEQNKGTVEDFVKNLDNQERAVKMAENIRAAFDRGWFTVADLTNAYRRVLKSKITKLTASGEDTEKSIQELSETTNESTTQELETLRLFGLVKKKSYKGGRKVKYKIVLTVVIRALERKALEEINAATSTKV